jgi:methylenetetrahydrofolate dehydrogenase (NADP+)/methenyltetrahydrofolate cyclohydrolase
MKILDGKSVAQEIRAEVKIAVDKLLQKGGRPPGLVAVLVGDDPASKVYVGTKERVAKEAGFVSRTLRLPADISQEGLIDEIVALNHEDAIDGILVQLPLPDGLDNDPILRAVSPEKDVDGFHPINVGRLWLGQPGFVPATPAGIMELLRRSRIELNGSHAVIIGRSAIVGKPMAGLLLKQHCTVTICHSRTKNLPEVCRQADILVAAVGRPGFVDETFVNPSATVIDVGINRITDAAEVDRFFPGNHAKSQQLKSKGSILVGDVDFTRVAPKVSAITPVPGGVGPLTVAMLLANTLRASRSRQGLGDTET